jgi:hypothetical protein
MPSIEALLERLAAEPGLEREERLRELAEEGRSDLMKDD